MRSFAAAYNSPFAGKYETGPSVTTRALICFPPKEAPKPNLSSGLPSWTKEAWTLPCSPAGPIHTTEERVPSPSKDSTSPVCLPISFSEGLNCTSSHEICKVICLLAIPSKMIARQPHDTMVEEKFVRLVEVSTRCVEAERPTNVIVEEQIASEPAKAPVTKQSGSSVGLVTPLAYTFHRWRPNDSPPICVSMMELGIKCTSHCSVARSITRYCLPPPTFVIGYPLYHTIYRHHPRLSIVKRSPCPSSMKEHEEPSSSLQNLSTTGRMTREVAKSWEDSGS